MIRGIDHIVILVSDLDQARADYTQLGFTVVVGGEHTGGATHNCLVAFADGAYLELIAFKRPEPGHRWWDQVATGGGLVDYALWPSAIAEDIAAAQARGLAYEGPLAGGRLRPDGQRVEWQNGLPPSPDLPFMCFDLTPRSLRVPHGSDAQHANGAVGVANLTVAVSDLEAAIANYRALLGTEPVLSTDPTQDSQAVFSLGSQTITLASPATDLSPLRQQLGSRGDGLYALDFRAAPGAQPPVLDEALTHGARLGWAS
jgi:catechol 2,3-dioxygenase-like lactoylglutathione lyase family enzyme